MGEEFLLNMDENSDELFSHELLKFLYGLFDENRDDNDPLVGFNFSAGHTIYPTVKQSQTYVSNELICEGKSLINVLDSNIDFDREKYRQENSPGYFEKVPQIRIVKKPSAKYVLVLETSSDMESNDDWYLINRASQKFIKFDLQDTAEIAIVTYSNVSRLEAPLTKVGGSRAKLTDIIPDKYSLGADRGHCMFCAFRMVMTEVLNGHEEGAHIIILSRGSYDTLSIREEQSMMEFVQYYQVLT